MANGDVLYEGSKSNEVCLTEEPIVWIPNAFSPNGDQINDWFPWPPGEANVGFLGNPQNGTPNFEMNVVSRWGTLIFRSESIDEPWDGTQDGKPVPHGHLRRAHPLLGWLRKVAQRKPSFVGVSRAMKGVHS